MTSSTRAACYGQKRTSTSKSKEAFATNKPENCEKYGRLYTWATTMDVDLSYNANQLGEIDFPRQGICPERTHLPTTWELQTRTTNLKNYPEYMVYFTNQLGGFFNYNEEFTALEEQNIVWSSTEYNATGTRYTFMSAWLHAFRKDLSIESPPKKKITKTYVRCIMLTRRPGKKWPRLRATAFLPSTPVMN